MFEKFVVGVCFEAYKLWILNFKFFCIHSYAFVPTWPSLYLQQVKQTP